jgi:hypothetical protein
VARCLTLSIVTEHERLDRRLKTIIMPKKSQKLKHCAHVTVAPLLLPLNVLLTKLHVLADTRATMRVEEELHTFFAFISSTKDHSSPFTTIMNSRITEFERWRDCVRVEDTL